MQNHLTVSTKGLDLTASEEAFRSVPYNDPRGFATVGYGHLIRRGPVQPTDQPITEEQALVYLHNDMLVAENVVNELVHIQLNQNQFDALVDFTYNVGAGTFAKSSVLVELNNGNFPMALIRLKEYIYAGTEVSKGLVNRRSQEVELFNS